MSIFKCYNCGDELKQLSENRRVYCCYNLVGSNKTPCYPSGSHYNSFIIFDSENKIKEYSFTSLINDTYYKLEAIKSSGISSLFLHKKIDERDIDWYITDCVFNYNKYFSITENYIKELPSLFDNLIKLAIFI